MRSGTVLLQPATSKQLHRPVAASASPASSSRNPHPCKSLLQIKQEKEEASKAQVKPQRTQLQTTAHEEEPEDSKPSPTCRPSPRSSSGHGPSPRSIPSPNSVPSPPPTPSSASSPRPILITAPSPSSQPKAFVLEDEQFTSATVRALRMLNRTALSSWELRTRLHERHDVDPDLAARVVHSLMDKGFQRDSDVCEVWVRSRWNQQRKSPGTIRQELLQKRIDPRLVDEALRNFFGAEPRIQPQDLSQAHRLMNAANPTLFYKGAERWDNPEHGQEIILAAELLDTVTRQVERMPQQLPKESKRRRLVAWLQRRGHAWDVISALMKLCIS